MKNKPAFFAALALFALCSWCFATQYSKLGIITASKKMGKWGAVKSWIAAAGYEDEWQACSYLSDDYPEFDAITNVLVSSGILAPAELAQIMSAALDTAVPDSMLQRVVENDCKTSSGRVRWHGRLVLQTIDTNACEKAELYEDGTVFTFPFKAPAAARPAAAKLNRQGVPVRLAEATARRVSEKATTNTVNVVVSPGKPAATVEETAADGKEAAE